MSLLNIDLKDLPDREPNDFYSTPGEATYDLLAREQFSRYVWEPACGTGAISTVLEDADYNVVSTDLLYRGYGEGGRDFLAEPELLAPSIITNPPFKLANEFAIHGMELGAKKMALFLRLAFLEGSKRHQILWSKYPPVRVWVFSRRLTLWRGDDPNPQSKGGAIPFCWIIWERGFKGTPTLGWIN